ncbi:MAG: type II toxin-antitoxin system VapC family toxin [Proteobacteria bacterium]|nr:type II toxin-antitoxin system VapC family toxin [Pseudomonadota bacterium]
MLTICDTHVLIFWVDNPDRLSEKAKTAFERALKSKSLACSDISLWEISMLFKANKLRNDISAEQYMQDIILTLSLKVLPITAKIAVTSQQDIFIHKDPADKLIAATAIVNNSPLISADSKLRNIVNLHVIW